MGRHTRVAHILSSRELKRYAGAIATHGALDTIFNALRAREARRAALRRELEGLNAATRIRSVDRARLERVLYETLANGRAVLAQHIGQKRRVMLRKVLQGRLVFTSCIDVRTRRHRKLAAIGRSQTAERLVAYLERRTPWDS